MNRTLASILSALLALAPLTAQAGVASVKGDSTTKPTTVKKTLVRADGKPVARKTAAAGAKVEDAANLTALQATPAKVGPEAVASEKAPLAKTTPAATPTPEKVAVETKPIDTKPVAESAGAAAKPAPIDSPTAAPAVDRVEAAKLAIWKRLFDENVPARMAAEGKFVTVHPVSTDFGGSAKNPITGMGPLVDSVRETYVTKDVTSQKLAQSAWGEAREYAKKLGMEDRIPAGAGEDLAGAHPGLWARIVNDHFSKYGNRTFVVDVDANGNGAQKGMGNIDAVQSHNFQAKLKSAFSTLKTVLTPQLLKDVAKATQPKQIATLVASITGVGGSIATANPIAMIAATAAAAVAIQSATSDIVKDVKAAIAARNLANNNAVVGSAKWARATLSTDDPATATEAYREYQSELATALPGTTAMSFEKYVGALQLQRL